jgi:predicted RNA-binding Zn-ribbon protein involved in translation (DUF1610 family)
VSPGPCPSCRVPIPASAVEGGRATCPNCGKRLRIRASAARPTVPDLCTIEQETTPEGPRITIVAKNTLSEGVKSGLALNRIVPMAFALLLLPMFFMTYRWWRVSAQELAIGLSLAVLAVSAIAIGVVIQSIGRVEIVATPERVIIRSGFWPLGFRWSLAREDVCWIRAGNDYLTDADANDAALYTGDITPYIGVRASIEVSTEDRLIRFGSGLNPRARTWIVQTLGRELGIAVRG